MIMDTFEPLTDLSPKAVDEFQQVLLEGKPRKKLTLPERLNNPGALKFRGQPGAEPGERGFARFRTMEEGWQALREQIERDKARGLTVRQFISKYAPPSENDTEAYIRAFTKRTGTSPDAILASVDTEAAARAIAQQETGKPPDLIGRVMSWLGPSQAEAAPLPRVKAGKSQAAAPKAEGSQGTFTLEPLVDLSKELSGTTQAQPTELEPLVPNLFGTPEQPRLPTQPKQPEQPEQPLPQVEAAQPAEIAPQAAPGHELPGQEEFVKETMPTLQSLPEGWETTLLDLVTSLGGLGAASAATKTIAMPLLRRLARGALGGAIFGLSKDLLGQAAQKEPESFGESIGKEAAIMAGIDVGLPLAGKGVMKVAKGVYSVTGSPLRKLADKYWSPAVDWTWENIAVPVLQKIPMPFTGGKSLLETVQPAASRLRRDLPVVMGSTRRAALEQHQMSSAATAVARKLGEMSPVERFNFARAMAGSAEPATDAVREAISLVEGALEKTSKPYQVHFLKEFEKRFKKVVPQLPEDLEEFMAKALEEIPGADVGGRFNQVQRFLAKLVKRPDVDPEVVALAKSLYNLPADTYRAISESATKAMRLDLIRRITNTPNLVSPTLRKGYVASKQPEIKGLFIPRDVELHLDAMRPQQFLIGKWGQFYREQLSRWKANKIIARPAAQFRNLFSNLMLNDIAGLPFWRVDIYRQALKGMRNNDKTFRKFVEVTGGEAGNFALADIEMLDGLLRHDDNLLKVLMSYYDRSLAPLKSTFSAAETWFKYAKYLHNLEVGMKPVEAGIDAVKTIFNYGEVTPFIAKLRTTALPFVTWWTKAIPMFVENAVKHPVRAGKWLLFYEWWRNNALAEVGVTEDEWKWIKENLPQWMQGGIWLPMPWRDDKGQLKFLNLTWMVPGIGDIAEIIKRGYDNPLTLILQNPILTVAGSLMTGHTEQGVPLYYEWEDPGMKLGKVLSYMWRTWSPAISPGNVDWQTVWDAINDRPEALTPEEAIASQFGLRLVTVDPRLNATRQAAVRRIHEAEAKMQMERELRKATSAQERDRIITRYRDIFRKIALE